MATHLPVLSIVTSLIAALGVAAAAHTRLEPPAASNDGPVIAARYGTDVTPARAEMIASQDGFTVARAANGMFYAPVRVNGQVREFLVDTGATMLVLSRADAAALGVDRAEMGSRRTMQTVGGEARVDLVRLDRVEFAGRTFKNVEAAIVEHGVGAPLLGQTLLARFDSLMINQDRLTVR